MQKTKTKERGNIEMGSSGVDVLILSCIQFMLDLVGL
jgi:hypothetical protein